MRVLHSLGFTQRRQTGSHIFYQHADGRTTLVPRHDQEDIGRGLLRQILREAEITPDEFLKHV
ncbi:MAG: type II toxin-antitoxin system HicA family toxin [bacterium]|nr:type II toxin-antitoxin system HicA family toxin [bacterium]